MTDSVPEIETVNAHMLVKFSVVVLGSLTRMLLGCADHLELHVYLLSILLCFGSIFSTLVMATLYVPDITCSVLLFFGILRCVGYGLSVCDAVLHECIIMLSRRFLPPPASNGAWHPTYDRPISPTCLTFHTSSKHLVSCQEHM